MDLFTVIYEEPSPELQKYAQECGYKYRKIIVGNTIVRWELVKHNVCSTCNKK